MILYTPIVLFKPDLWRDVLGSCWTVALLDNVFWLHVWYKAMWGTIYTYTRGSDNYGDSDWPPSELTDYFRFWPTSLEIDWPIRILTDHPGDSDWPLWILTDHSGFWLTILGILTDHSGFWLTVLTKHTGNSNWPPWVFWLTTHGILTDLTEILTGQSGILNWPPWVFWPTILGILTDHPGDYSDWPSWGLFWLTILGINYSDWPHWGFWLTILGTDLEILTPPSDSDCSLWGF